jgi:hypothetical protein
VKAVFNPKPLVGDEFFASIFEGVEELVVVFEEAVDARAAEMNIVFTSLLDEFNSDFPLGNSVTAVCFGSGGDEHPMCKFQKELL